MAKLVRIDLEVENISKIGNIIEADKTACRAIINNLEEFSNAADLKGLDYDIAKNKAKRYIIILNNRIELDNFIIKSITDMCTTLKNYMEGYDILDDSMIDEIESEIARAQSLASQFEESLKEINALNSSDDSSQPQNLNRTLHGYYSIINELKNKIYKLRELTDITNRCNDRYIVPLNETTDTHSKDINKISVSNIETVISRYNDAINKGITIN